MKITDIFESKIFVVETNEGEYYKYTRYGEDNWFIRMGESLEPLYDCKEIEKEFQKYMDQENDVFLLFPLW